MSTGNGVTNIPNIDFFLTILKFILNFPYGKQGCVFFALHRHVFSQCIKMT